MSQPSWVRERSKAVIFRNLFNDPSELLRLGRFELVRTLGSGGMGVVYEALDPLRGERVALKTLKGRGAGDLYRLKREFRSLAELAHPNLVVLHELSIAQQHAFFTMELVFGKDIVTYIRQDAGTSGLARDLGRLKNALAQLCDGICALHRAGKLHRDLKPSNVLVTDGGRVVLLDFGLVQELREQRAEIGGTPEYMAPEQCMGRACEASDWYAFGRILQQALYGPARPAASHASEERAPVLSQLADALLHPDPGRRPGWREIASIVDRGAQRDAPAAVAARGGFVGRAAELTTLERAFAQSKREPVLALLRGESGIGKTTLMRQFVGVTLRTSDAIVLSSRCYEHEFVPFKALDNVVDELSRHLSGLPSERFAGLGADQRRALVQLFPVLGRVPWLATAPAEGDDDAHPVMLRRRGVDALRKIFAILAAERPLVLCIDDVQWSDEDSGVLLAALLCDQDAPPLLIIASDRTDPGRLNPAIEELYRASQNAPRSATIVELTLGALSRREAAALARTLLTSEGNDSEAMPALIAAEAHGNPLFLKELSRWAAAPPAGFDGAPGGISIDSIVTSRASALSDAARRTLELIAIAGRPLSTAMIGQALGLERALHLAVRELRHARLVHLVRRADSELLELDHDRIGEALLRRLESAHRQRLHAQLAHALDARDIHAEGAVAQYIAAQLPEQAARRAREAGYLALAALAFSRAAWLFRQALELGSWPDATRAHLYGELALALEHAGRGLEAAEAYMRAAALQADPRVSVQLDALAAGHLSHNGRHLEGFALLRRCYERLGTRWPESRLGLVFAILWLFITLQLRWLMGPPAGGDDELALARARLFSESGFPLEGHDVLRALYNALLALRAAGRLRDEVWRARALGLRGLLRCASLFWGGAARGSAEIESACAAAERLGDLPAMVDLQRQLSVGLYLSGKPRAALAWANRADANMRLLRLAPRTRYLLTGLIGCVLLDLGELREAHRRWSEFAHEAREHGDVLTGFWTHAHPVQFAILFARDDRAGAMAILEKQAQLRARHPKYRQLSWSHAMCCAEMELYWGCPASALRSIEREWPALQLGFDVFKNYALLLRARAALGAAVELPHGAERAKLIRQATSSVRTLRRCQQPLTRAGAQLVRAGAATLRGRRRSAQRLLEAAITLFDGAESKLLTACAQHCLGALLSDRARGRALQAAATEILTSEGVVEPERWVAWIIPAWRGLNGVSHA